MRKTIKDIIYRHDKLNSFMTLLFQFFGLRKTNKGKNNKILNQSTVIMKTKVQFIGSNNKIIFGENSVIKKSLIEITGDYNSIFIGDHVHLNDVHISIGDNENVVRIGDKTTINPRAYIRSSEGGQINIGKDCMFASDVTFRNGDSHAILNLDTGKRINKGKDINIGDHVWLGQKVTITKGVVIKDNSVVGIGSLVNKTFMEEGIILGGVPAKVLKNNITWLR